MTNPPNTSTTKAEEIKEGTLPSLREILFLLRKSSTAQSTMDKVRELVKDRKKACKEVHATGREGQWCTQWQLNVFVDFPQIAESMEKMYKDCCVMRDRLEIIERAWQDFKDCEGAEPHMENWFLNCSLEAKEALSKVAHYPKPDATT